MFIPYKYDNGNSVVKSPLRVRDCLPTVGLISICSDTEVNNLAATLGLACGRQVELRSRC